MLPVLLGLGVPVSSSMASPLVSIGDNASVYFDGTSELRWSSNIYRNARSAVDDLTWTLSPGFEINVGGDQSNADLSVVTRYDIVRYNEQKDNDTELFHIKALGSYSSSRLDLSGSISFDEDESNSGDKNVVNDLVGTDTTNAALNAEYEVSPKFNIGSGVRYREQEYQKPYAGRFADQTVTTVPVDVFYELTPKFDLSIGYQYKNTEVGETANASFYTSDYETDGHFFNVGARGDLLPKLSGFFKVGYSYTDRGDSTRIADPSGAATPSADINRDSAGMLGLDADLSWEMTPKITAVLGLSRDFGAGSQGEETEKSAINLNAIYTISSSLSANAKLAYTLTDYTETPDDREDELYSAGLGLSYSPDEHWSLSGGYNYAENDSSRASNSYEDHSLNFTATLRY